MGEMATNLLVLLSWLAESQVALRDLKPDNLLVAGNPAEYPNFLSSAKQYAIGLIDLETAVDYGGKIQAAIPQPQLGGTPLYATPSHFFQNGLLKEIHGEISHVLHLQDWYAITAIIYEMIVGECIFSRTARQFAALMQNLQASIAQGENLIKAYLAMSDRFWAISTAEFASAMELNGKLLESISVKVPESVRSALHESVRMKKTHEWEKIEACLDASPVLSRKDNRNRLMQCNATQVNQIREKYAKSGKAENLLPVFDELISLKRSSERLERLDERLSLPFPKINGRELLGSMYEVIVEGLRPDPASFAKIEIPELPAPAADGAMDETVQGETIRGTHREGLGYTHTVALE